MFMGELYCEIEFLRLGIEDKMQHIDEGIRKQLYMLMAYEGNSIIKQSDYNEIMLPMACFSATDVNNDNELDIIELKTLFWLMNGKEPENAQILKEMELIDADKGGTVDRLEWIQYLVSPDPDTGASYFDLDLRNSFQSFDTNKDGNLSLEEFANFLKADTI